MRVLLDTNVILDVLPARAPHAAPATALLDQVAARTVDGQLGARVTTIHYLAAKAVGPASAERHARTLLGVFEVAPVTRAVLTAALDLAYHDYEDAVLHAAANHAGAKAIVLRDSKGISIANSLRPYV
ncbi:MAG: PIN domain-containing protein [Gemmatimonadales bacterium]